MEHHELATTALPADQVGLLEGLTSTRAIRRYRAEPIDEAALRAMLFAATRAPSGSNRQPFRFVVLTEGPIASEAKALLARGARAAWDAKRRADGYDQGSGLAPSSRKARMAASMEHYVHHLDEVPALVLPCILMHRELGLTDGASVYPACQNLLLAARALGYGGVFTSWYAAVEAELRQLLGIPDDVRICGAITLGRPEGHHGPVRRRPLQELVSGARWGEAPDWAVDPPGTSYTAAGPPGRS